MLSQHTHVFMSVPKEPCFFSFRDYAEKIDQYSRLFTQVTNEKIVGEASPIYSETTLIPEVPKRISNFNPEAKVIYIVREPIERLKSVWRQTLYTGHWHKKKYMEHTDVDVPLMSKNFEKAIFEYPSFLAATRYWTHLNNYRAYFDDSKILLLFFEDLKRNPEYVYKTICNFLEIKAQITPAIFIKKNTSKGRTQDYPPIAFLKKFGFLKTGYRLLNKVGGDAINVPKKEIPYEIEISKDVITQIHLELEEEMRLILAYGAKPERFWDSV